RERPRCAAGRRQPLSSSAAQYEARTGGAGKVKFAEHMARGCFRDKAGSGHKPMICSSDNLLFFHVRDSLVTDFPKFAVAP
ncbi:MAG TPA: hypothetical protein VNN06_19180, partial [Ramlibacter sp.]|nr:hypothetical protein [Ramlibacter sp.]